MRVCFITPRFPYPLDRGDRVRAYHQIRQLSSRGHYITLISAADHYVSPSEREQVATWCNDVHIISLKKVDIAARILRGASTGLPLQVLYYYDHALSERAAAALASEPFDVVHVSLARVLPAVRHAGNVPVLVDLMDAFSRGLKTCRAYAPWTLRGLYALEAVRMHRYELSACADYKILTVCSEADRQYLGCSNVTYLPQGVDCGALPFAMERPYSDVVAITGNMGYPPNIDAVVWFVENVWPKVRAVSNDARLRIIGARPAKSVRSLAHRPGIEVTGRVADIGAELRQATIAVSPVRSGAGVQTKLLEAMASGTATVSTSFANQGIGAISGQSTLIADSSSDFAAAILQLLNDRSLRERVALNAHELIESRFSWDAHAGRLESLYARVRERHDVNDGSRKAAS